jgi:hypothetical protein
VTKFISSLSSWIVFLIMIVSIVIMEIWPLSFLLIIPYLIWIYSLGVESNRALTIDLKMSRSKLKAALIYSGGYGIVAGFYFKKIMPYAIPFHLFAMFCLFYSIYFVAKNMKSAELAREAKFEEYFAIFFGFWFLPIGVWFIQRKIKRIANSNSYSA